MKLADLIDVLCARIRTSARCGVRVALVVLACAGASVVQAAGQSMTAIDRALPEFELQSLDGGSRTPESLKGKPWIINFWASWCGPCVEEIPAMNRAWEAVEPDGIGMLAINAGESLGTIQTFLAQVPVDFEVLVGEPTTLPNWQVIALPTTIVVDSNGRVVFQALGPREWDDPELLDQVRALLDG